jgi:2-haloacid dehalogenase
MASRTTSRTTSTGAAQSMRASLPIKAVAFDAYGTLFDVYSVGALAEQCFPGRGEALTQLWRSKQLEYSWLYTMSGRYKSFWEITRDALAFSAHRLGLALDAATESRLMNQYACLSAFPESIGALRQLREMGLPLAILSNGNRDMLEVSVRSAGMQGCFDHLLSSESVGAFKTDSRVYDLGPAAFGCTAGEILFVSSNCWDAIAATWYGYRTFWINRTGAPLEALGTEPEGSGSLLSDAVEHLRRLVSAAPAVPAR